MDADTKARYDRCYEATIGLGEETAQILCEQSVLASRRRMLASTKSRSRIRSRSSNLRRSNRRRTRVNKSNKN